MFKNLGYSLFVLLLFGISFAQIDTSKYDKFFKGQLTSIDEVLEEGEHYDFYDFNFKKGQEISFELSSDDFDTYLFLVTPEGPSFDADDYKSEDAKFVTRLAIPIAADGPYQIVVTSLHAHEKGDYILGMNIKEDFYQDFVTGTIEAPDKTLEENHFYDEFKLTISEGEIVTMALISPDFDTLLKLTMPDGETLTSDDVDGQIGLSRLSFTAKESGIYKILVSSSYVGEVGEYRLSLAYQ